ncbi:MAG: 4-alpha-glucanotransferase [Alphaproteobacteria bacterium]
MVLEYSQTVDILAEKAGILPEFEADGGIYTTSFETKKALLDALGFPVKTAKEAQESLQTVLEKPYKTALPPVTVISAEKKIAEVTVTFAAGHESEPLSFEIIQENGEIVSGQKKTADLPVTDSLVIKETEYEHRRLTIDLPAQTGYHTLRVSGAALPDQGREMALIVVPEKCYMPETMRQGAKPWGFPLQLYALRSKRNWGIGDFSDLKEMAGVAKSFGADIIGINPINVAFMAKPETASPYYSSCRLFLNPLYIDVTAVPEAEKCAALQKYMQSKPFADALKKVRTERLVDYKAVAKLKKKAFELLFDDFKNAADDRRASFKSFCEKGGRDLQTAALYQALADYFVGKKKSFGFKSWGKQYASPDTPASLKFAEEQAEKITYYKYLFWLADEQFQAASAESINQGLAVGLYQDLAVGVAGESAETWGNQELFALGLSIGSPPDMFNANGQEWGVAPMRPDVMRDEAYASYRKVLTANMKRAGAVRIDHVMGLARLFCIPQGEKGAYLRYNVNDLIGIVALESHRNKCLVVGEDLGVVPSYFREILEKAGILSFRVFRYEQTNEGHYKPLNVYPKTALVAAGTHDMPTLTGFWSGADIETAKEIGLMGDDGRYEQAQALRMKDRYAMVETLASRGLWFVSPEAFDEEISGRKVPFRLMEVLYSYLASAPCCLLLVQLEDILGQAEQMNVPGTNQEYPNWRCKLPKMIENLYNDENMKRVCSAIRQIRQS